jgi:hypothetical protein
MWAFLDMQVIEQANGVLGHFHAVLLRVVGLVALAVATVVQSNDLVIFAQAFDDSGHLPVRFGVDEKSVNEQNGFAFAFDDVANLDAV